MIRPYCQRVKPLSQRQLDELGALDPFSDRIEAAVRPQLSAQDRQSSGQVFTPWPVAAWMARWVLGAGPARALDPACGTGVFARALAGQAAAQLRIECRDLDPAMLAAAKAGAGGRLGPAQASWQAGDFMESGWDERYDAIIANPPYVKHHRLAAKSRYQEACRRELGAELPATSNLYCWFMAKALSQLAPGGRMAFITPSEFLNANYGTALKRWLLQSGTWKALVTFGFADEVFSDALTTAAVSLFERSPQPADGLLLVSASAEHLDAAEAAVAGRPSEHAKARMVSTGGLDPARKWAQYIRPDVRVPTGGLVAFTRYARAKRGIATGHNAFFVFGRDRAAELQMDPEWLVPCLTKAAHASHPVLTAARMQEMADAGQKVSLLYLDGSEPRTGALDACLSAGEADGVHLRYLTRSRSPWWAMERKDPPDIFVTVFGREGMRAVRNEAGARSLACCHGVYVNDPADADLVMAWLATGAAREIIRHERREYGAGLEKLEPGDINKSLIPDLDAIPEGRRKEILGAYAGWRAAALAGDSSALAGLGGALEQLFLQG